MQRPGTIALAALLVAAVAEAAWSQQVQSGQMATGQSGIATGTFGQTVPQTPPANPATPLGGGTATPLGGSPLATPLTPTPVTIQGMNAPGQTLRPGQLPFTPLTSGGNITPSRSPNLLPRALEGRLPDGRLIDGRFVNRAFVDGRFFINPTPWFSDLAVRQQLALGEAQFQQLQSAYLDAWTRFDEAINALPANLTAAAHARRLAALREGFDQQFEESLNTVLVDPRQRARFNQLGAQFQRLGQIEDRVLPPPDRLTPPQEQRLRLMADQWNQLAEQARQRADSEPSASRAQMEELQAEAQRQIEAVLTPQQFPRWAELVGPYYDLREQPGERANSADTADPEQRSQ